MYKEKVGSTAVRKSSKIRDIVEDFAKRLPRITEPEDLVSYSYFFVRLIDFDISGRIDRRLKQDLIAKATQAATTKPMPFDELLRLFGDLSQVDPVIGIANKISDIVRDENKPMSEADR